MPCVRGFSIGCPLATIALETTPDDDAIRAALAEGFSIICARMSGALAGAGMPKTQAAGVAALMVSSFEGALLQARVAGSVQTMRDTADVLMGLLRLALGQREAKNT